MLASIHLADVRLITALKSLRTGPKPESTPGLRYATTVACAPLGGPVLTAPQLRRLGLIALWDDDAALDGFLASHPLATALAGGWHVRLATIQAHEYHQARGSDVAGSWPGLTSDVTDPTRPDDPATGRGTVVVLTWPGPGSLSCHVSPGPASRRLVPWRAPKG